MKFFGYNFVIFCLDFKQDNGKGLTICHKGIIISCFWIGSEKFSKVLNNSKHWGLFFTSTYLLSLCLSSWLYFRPEQHAHSNQMREAGDSLWRRPAMEARDRGHPDTEDGHSESASLDLSLSFRYPEPISWASWLDSVIFGYVEGSADFGIVVFKKILYVSALF
jgi:hypothetical protein